MTAARRSSPPRTVRPSRVRPRSLLIHVALLLVLGIGVAIGAGVLLWLGLGRPQLSTTVADTTSAQQRRSPSPGGPVLTSAEWLDSVKIVLAVAGGVGAVVALTVAYRKQRDSELAEYREDARVFTDRFTAAAEQLGGGSAAVRVSGIYALAELADDWRDGRQMCIEVLCAYLPMPYETDPTKPDYSLNEREVRRTLIRVIRNHLRPSDTAVSWSGNKFSFEGAVFERGDLSGARLEGEGHMTFHGVTFLGDYFLFDGADFNGRPVWFTEATFSSPMVSFKNVTFGRNRVEFDRANFVSGNVTFESATANPGNVTFADARHSGGTVDWGPFAPPMTP
jgi:hypothetical protein